MSVKPSRHTHRDAASFRKDGRPSGSGHESRRRVLTRRVHLESLIGPYNLGSLKAFTGALSSQTDYTMPYASSQPALQTA